MTLLPALLALVTSALASLAPAAQDEPTAPTAATAVEPAFLLKLRDGSIRWGSLESHDPDGLGFRRLDNGGFVHLPWRFLDPEQEQELRRRYGYVDESGDEPMVEAQRIELIDGREVVGLVLSRGADALVLKRAEATIPVPLDRIAAAATTVVVPALEIYTRAELYQQELARTALEDARSRLALAAYCERILDFPHAVEHYRKALELDPALAGPDTRFALERASEKAARQAEIDWLAEVDQLAAREKYAAALEQAQAFAERYPDSPLRPDAKKRVERVVRARDRALSELVQRRWHSAATQLARRAVSKTLDEVVAWVEDSLNDEILKVVVDEARRLDPSIDPDRVRELWLKREGGRWRLASYGYGTWLLGEDKALAGLEEEEEEPEQAAITDKDKERKALEERIKRYLENQRQQRRQSASADEGELREQTWREMSSAGRSGWILAYWAESTGDVQVRERVLFRACRECGGTGVRETITTGDARTRGDGQTGQGSGINRIPCPTCHGLGIIRRIQYR